MLLYMRVLGSSHACGCISTAARGLITPVCQQAAPRRAQLSKPFLPGPSHRLHSGLQEWPEGLLGCSVAGAKNAPATQWNACLVVTGHTAAPVMPGLVHTACWPGCCCVSNTCDTLP
jgi:hypothetical protein